MMRMICSWCRAEGKPGLIGDRPPLDDPTETHGICQEHKRAVLETLPSASFPNADLLIVVHPREEQLFQYLERAWAGVRGVKVIRDRRRGERRREQRPVESERRLGADARIRDVEFMTPGYLMVRFRRRGNLPS